MLIESKIKIGYDSMFNVPQAYFKSAHLLNKMALVQFQCSRTVHTVACIETRRLGNLPYKPDISN